MAKLPRTGVPEMGRGMAGLGGVGGQLHRGDRVGAHHVAHRRRAEPARSRAPAPASGVANSEQPARVRAARTSAASPGRRRRAGPAGAVGGRGACHRWGRTLATPTGIRASSPVRIPGGGPRLRDARSRGTLDGEGELIHVAPPPVLSRLERLDQRMAGLVEMGGGVPARRVVTAPHMAADACTPGGAPTVAAERAGSPRTRPTTASPLGPGPDGGRTPRPQSWRLLRPVRRDRSAHPARSDGTGAREPDGPHGQRDGHGTAVGQCVVELPQGAAGGHPCVPGPLDGHGPGQIGRGLGGPGAVAGHLRPGGRQSAAVPSRA